MKSLSALGGTVLTALFAVWLVSYGVMWLFQFGRFSPTGPEYTQPSYQQRTVRRAPPQIVHRHYPARIETYIGGVRVE